MVNLSKKPHIILPSTITKSKKSRLIPIGKEAFNLIKIFEAQLIAKRKKNPHWYSGKPVSECYLLQKKRGFGRYECRSIQDIFRKQMNEAGLPKELKFHCLRHSFATHILEIKPDIYAVSKVMGHSTPNVTAQFYDHTTALNYRSVMDLL